MNKVKANNFGYIKVWDLLKKIWSKDIINISDIKINWLDHITHISWKVFLQSISDEEIYMRIEHINYEWDNLCDYCGNKTTQKMDIQQQSHRYIKNLDQEKYKLEIWDELWPINGDMSIDIITPITNAILINDTVQHICKDCKNNNTIKGIDDPEINHPIFV